MEFTMPFSLGTVLLGAGKSRRMGRPKLLLPWGSTSVLGHLIAQWRNLGAAQVAVVCAAADRRLQAELDRLGFPPEVRIHNPAPERGMFSSIQCAARWPGWQAGLTHLAIVLGDQPHLRPATLRALCEFSAAHPGQVCQPACGGHRRHPVFLPRALLGGLAESKAGNLKEYLASFQPAVCELDDPGLDLDIDRPEDYEKALGLANERAVKENSR